MQLVNYLASEKIPGYIKRADTCALYHYLQDVNNGIKQIPTGPWTGDYIKNLIQVELDSRFLGTNTTPELYCSTSNNDTNIFDDTPGTTRGNDTVTGDKTSGNSTPYIATQNPGTGNNTNNLVDQVKTTASNFGWGKIALIGIAAWLIFRRR